MKRMNLPTALANAIADKIVEWGIWYERPLIKLLPEYDTTKDDGIKLFVMPSNVTTDSYVARGCIKQLFATQVVTMQYLPDTDIDIANDALNILTDISEKFANQKIEFSDTFVMIKTIIMLGATEVMWNGDYQVDGLLKQDTLSDADVLSTSLVLVGERFLG